jgi:mono/diheme cytochrome c family protein
VTRAMPTLLTALCLATVAASTSRAQEAGDPDRGRVVYRSVGFCGNCHGWAGDGKAGTALQAPVGADLRTTELDTAALTEVIGCGIPGTPMPYHDRAAYRDGRCFGMSLDEFEPGAAPRKGKTFSDADVANVVAYLQAHVIGQGEPTHAECAEFYGDPSAAACAGLE